MIKGAHHTHSLNDLFEVYMVDLFSYREETNWKNRFDSSLVNGRYPISSTIISLNLEYVFILYSSLLRS